MDKVTEMKRGPELLMEMDIGKWIDWVQWTGFYNTGVLFCFVFVLFIYLKIICSVKINYYYYYY